MIFQFRVDMFLRPNNDKTTSDFIMCVCVYLQYIYLQNKSKTNDFLCQISRLFVLLKGAIPHPKECDSSFNMKRDFYYDAYTILNRIYLTRRTKCAFRLMSPHRWPLAKDDSLKKLKVLPRKCKNKLWPKTTHEMSSITVFLAANVALNVILFKSCSYQ